MSASTTRLPWKSSRTSTQAISVPSTALTSATSSALTTVRRIAAAASGVVTASQNDAEPVLLGVPHDDAERDEHEQAQPQRGDADAERRCRG